MSYVINLCTRNQSTGVVDGRSTDLSSKVLNGFSLLEKLDDSLDIGQITLRGILTSTPYDMFDWIEVYEDTTLLYSMRIAGDNVSLISKNPLLYQHTLSLVEHTKILERFQISGKTFTQPTDGTIRYYLYDTIESLINTTPLEMSDDLEFTRVIVLPTSGDLYDLLTTTISPEFTFKDLSLREALTQVCGYVDGIPRVYLNSSDELELQLDFVNELKDLITSNYIDISTSQDLDLYATQLESEVLNAVNDESIGESLEVHPTLGGYISGRSDSYIYSYDKSYIPTPKPIYSIKHCYLPINILARNTSTGVFYYGSTTDLERVIVDLAPRIVEYNVFKTLEYGITGQELYRQNTLFYEYRKPNIQLGETYGLFDTKIVLENVVEQAVIYQLLEDGIITTSDVPNVVVTYVEFNENLVYQTHYVPVPTSQRLNIDRQDLSDVSYNSAILSNQQSRLVNLENFTNNMQGRINRIGNSEIQLDFRASLYEDLPEIGDYTDDLYIVTLKETLFYKDYVYCKLGLSKNYNMISRFIGVNSEIRQWEMGEQNTLDRNIIYKEYVEIDAVSSHTDASTTKLLTTDGIKTFMQTFDPASIFEPIRSGIILGSNIPENSLVSLSSNGGGNSLIFNWKFPNNKSIGAFKEDDVVLSVTQTVNNFTSYTTDAGLLDEFELRMFDSVTQGDNTLAEYLATGDDYPKLDSSTIDTTLLSTASNFMVDKDSREIIGGTIQLQMVSLDNSKVGLGRYLSLRNRLVTENPPTGIRLYTSTTASFNRSNTLDVHTGYTLQSTPTLIFNYTNKNITISTTADFTDWASYCLTDENDKILLWVNNDYEELDVISFDFKNKRTGIKYRY